jgi:hypothetical protein
MDAGSRCIIVVTKPNMPRTTTMVRVDQFSGMIGIPEVSGPGRLWRIRRRQLNPALRINGRINVESEFATFNTGNLFISELSGDATANGEYNICDEAFRRFAQRSVANRDRRPARRHTAPAATEIATQQTES